MPPLLLRLRTLFAVPTPNNVAKSPQSACPPKNARTCESVKFDGSIISGICTFASDGILSAQVGKMSCRLTGARVAVEAAGVAVRVTVTSVVAVTTTLAAAEVEEVAGSEVVRAVEDVVVVELSDDAPVAVTVAAAGVKKTVVLT